MASDVRPVSFEVNATCGAARAGTFRTSHGDVHTPAFMPVGTQATVKAVSADEIRASGAEMVIMNTYHLWQRPGPEIVKELGGLHAFSRYEGVIATDSGGFQAFSLGERTKVTEEGFQFSSHIDGTKLLLSPEKAMELQCALGADVAMQLDVCLPGQATRDELIAAMDRTTRWGRRCLDARRPLDRGGGSQAVFGIAQGGADVELRLRHMRTISDMEFDGVALGGFSVGEPPETMHQVLRDIAPRMDPARIRYLMGVGTPGDIVRAIDSGIDLFDCVMPTRNARNGQAFVSGGKIVIKNASYRADQRVLDEECECPVCLGGYSRAYLRHLYVAGEILVHRFISLHNLHYYGRLVRSARAAILQNQYAAFRQAILGRG